MAAGDGVGIEIKVILHDRRRIAVIVFGELTFIRVRMRGRGRKVPGKLIASTSRHALILIPLTSRAIAARAGQFTNSPRCGETR